MGLLGSIKDRVLHRNNEDDFDDFRSHILGQEQTVPAEPEPAPPQKIYEREPPAQNELSAFSFEEPQQKDVQEVSKNYEIMDRLEMIGAQLSAIRSQTETINERLKNLEMKLTTRRY